MSTDSLPETVIITTRNGVRAKFRRVEEEDARSRRRSRGIYRDPSSAGSHWSFYSTTSTNCTASGIPGPGRLLGKVLNVAGRSLERGIASLANKTSTSGSTSRSHWQVVLSICEDLGESSIGCLLEAAG